jgi:MFS family permease
MASLSHRNYRLFFFGQLVSQAGTWMQTVAQSFLVLGLTRSGTQLGLTTAARFLPVLLFGQAGGLFADRADKRRVMALWGLAWLGSTPIGGSIVGWTGQDAGARWSLVVGGRLRSFAACSPSRPSPASTAAVPPRIAFHDHVKKARV